MKPYRPGLHLLATFTSPVGHLADMDGCKQLFDKLILEHALTNVGETYHRFPGNGFTATVCLTESHLSMHTWPEYGLATFDVFLSNYKMDNEQKVRAIYYSVLEGFAGTEQSKQEVWR